MPTELKKALVRRVGKLVFRVTKDGIYIRGHHKHKWKHVSWERIASLLADEGIPICEELEDKIGKAVLQKIGAQPKADRGKENTRGH